MTIGEVARQTGFNPSAIRYYERRGLIEAPDRVSGWRRYGPQVIERLRILKIATACGFSLDETRALLDAMDQGQAPSEPLQTLAERKLPALRTTLARTQLLIDLLVAAESCACPSLAVCADRASEAGV